MKAVLEFNLPDDQEDFQLAVNATKWYLSMHELDQHLRARLKYEETLTDEQHDILQDTRDKLYEIMNENNVSF